MKKFKELTPGDILYIITGFSRTIEGLRIKKMEYNRITSSVYFYLEDNREYCVSLYDYMNSSYTIRNVGGKNFIVTSDIDDVKRHQISFQKEIECVLRTHKIQNYE